MQPKEKKIGDCTYRVRPLGAEDASEMLTRILKVIMPALESLESLSDAEARVGRIIADFSRNVTVSDMHYLRNMFAKVTEVIITEPDGSVREPILADEIKGRQHFAGAMEHYMEWLAFCLEVNFGSFFRGLRGRAQSALAGLKKKTPSPSTSPSTSTGGSGAS